MTAAKTEPKGLHAKLAEVMADAGRIPKNGTAPKEMGGFAFVQVGDAADSIRSALGSRGVSMLPTAVDVVGEAEHETKSGAMMTTLRLRTTWTLTDGETGQTATIQSIGEGADRGDKAAPKAQTNSMKYALLMGFLLSTGDDPEQQDSSDRQRIAGQETAELVGMKVVTGVIQVGDAERYRAEWRNGPDERPVIGFRLKRPGDRDIPQVGVMGALAEGLAAYYGEESIVGKTVTMRGREYAVRQQGRTGYVRIIAGLGTDDYIETPDIRIPAEPPSEPPPQAAPVEAESLPAFDMDAVDAEDRAMAGVPNA